MGLFGVFDGHGGKHAATFASNHVMANLLDVLKGAEAAAGTVRVLLTPVILLRSLVAAPLTRACLLACQIVPSVVRLAAETPIQN